MSRSKQLHRPNQQQSRKATQTPLGLRGALQLCTGMMVLGLASILGMHFASGSMADMSFLVGASSLTMGALWLVTSDFGFSKPSMGISIGGASIVAIASGALVFGNGETVEETTVTKNPLRYYRPLASPDADKGNDVEQKASFDRSQSNKGPNLLMEIDLWVLQQPLYEMLKSPIRLTKKCLQLQINTSVPKNPQSQRSRLQVTI